jgi:tetratricopeptide (TPR) repeat protein
MTMDNLRFEAACKLRDQGQLDEAVQEFINIAQETSDPTDKAGVLLNAATIFKSVGKFDLALETMSQVKAIVSNLGLSEQQSSEDDRKVWLQMAVGFEEAEILQMQGKRDEALAKFERLESQFSTYLHTATHRNDYEMIRSRRGFLLADLGRWKEALPILEEIDSSPEQKGLISFYLGSAYAASGQDSRSSEKLAQAIRLHLPPHLEFRAHCTLGKAYHKLERYAQAKVELEKCVETADPEYIRQAEIWTWLEATCRHLGLKDEAARYAQMGNPPF